MKICEEIECYSYSLVSVRSFNVVFFGGVGVENDGIEKRILGVYMLLNLLIGKVSRGSVFKCSSGGSRMIRLTTPISRKRRNDRGIVREIGFGRSLNLGAGIDLFYSSSSNNYN